MSDVELGSIGFTMATFSASFEPRSSLIKSCLHGDCDELPVVILARAATAPRKHTTTGHGYVRMIPAGHHYRIAVAPPPIAVTNDDDVLF